MQKKIAFTLLEVLLATVIFMMAVAGFFATLNAVRQPVLENERSLTAAIFGQQELETLRNQVMANSTTTISADGYEYGGPLSLGPHTITNTDQTGTIYNINYTVSCTSAGNNGLCKQDTPVMVNETVSFQDA